MSKARLARLRLGGITSSDVLAEDILQNAMLAYVVDVTSETYSIFRVERRKPLALAPGLLQTF